MRYKITSEPLYEYEAKSFIKDIINNRTIKSEMDDIVERRGSRYKSAVAPFFRNALALEKHIKSNINFIPPPFCENGHELADFLFLQRGEDELYFCDVFYYYTRLKKQGRDNKYATILGVLNEEQYFSTYGFDNPPIIDSAGDFFTLLESWDISSQEKIGALRVYHNFDQYLAYFSTIVDQATTLILDKIPDYAKKIESHLDYISTQLTNDSDFLQETFGVKLDDSHVYTVYPGLHAPNSIGYILNADTEVSIVVGLDIFNLKSAFDDMQLDEEKSELFLKCLADSTKLAILKLLKNEPMYGSQLAEKLNCTSANISHHMSTLLNLRLVRAEKKNNRLYLHIDKEEIARQLDDAKGLFV